MEYVKGVPYFANGEKKIKQYNYLSRDISCDVLIIGGGIDGAIANYYLSQKFDVMLVDKWRFGYSCTSCATALLEYQLDDFAKDLQKYMTTEQICQAYQMGLDAIEKLQKFISKHGNDCHFKKRSTFLYTSEKSLRKDLLCEFNFRQNNGFDCLFIDKDNNPFPFLVQAGIYTPNGGAEVNPYLLTKQMIENSLNQNKIFENTDIAKLIKQKNGYTAVSSSGEKINAKKIIVATGFNWELLNINDLCERFISYSIVTKPINGFAWHNKALIHDCASPYHYLRQLPDNRIIFGGEDTLFKGKPISEKKSNKIYKKLEKSLFSILPKLKGLKIDYKFCGAFGTTKNNLGLIGESKIDKDILLFISCGANGIINAIKGVEILEDIILGKENELLSLFSHKRKNI